MSDENSHRHFPLNSLLSFGHLVQLARSQLISEWTTESRILVHREYWIQSSTLGGVVEDPQWSNHRLLMTKKTSLSEKVDERMMRILTDFTTPFARDGGRVWLLEKRRRMEGKSFQSSYLSSRFNGLCEKAFLIVWLPLFIGWVTLFGATGWFPLAATIGDDDEGRMPFVRAVRWLFGMVENWFKRSWGRSSWSKTIDRQNAQKKTNIRSLPGMRGGPIFNVIVRPESLIRLTTSVCGIWVRSTLFTAKIRSLTCSWPHWSAGLFGMILPKTKCTAITISSRGADVEQDNDHFPRLYKDLKGRTRMFRRYVHADLDSIFMHSCVADLSKLYAEDHCPSVFVLVHLFRSVCRWERTIVSEGKCNLPTVAPALFWEEMMTKPKLWLSLIFCNVT